MVRGIRVDTGTCQCSLSVSSLEEVWGIKRKQGRNLLDKMEQQGLISRSSDFVTSIVDVVSVQDGHAVGQAFTNPNRLLLAERNQTSPFYHHQSNLHKAQIWLLSSWRHQKSLRRLL